MGEGNDKANGADKRSHPRVDFFRKVKVTIPDESTAVDLFAGNVSEGGMFLRSNRPLGKGRKIGLDFDVDNVPVRVDEGEVAWSKPFEPISVDGAPAGMGIRFTRMDDASRQRIASFIEEELRNAPRSPLPAEPEPAPASTPVEVPAVSRDNKPRPPTPQPARARLPLSQDPAPRPEPASVATPEAARGENLMVSDPPPAKSRALMFGIFVLFVAVVTFVTLYFIKPFDQADPQPAAGTPARDDAQPAPSGASSAGPASDKTAPVETQDAPAAKQKPAPGAQKDIEDTPATEDKPETGEQQDSATAPAAPSLEPKQQPDAAAAAAAVGVPVFSLAGDGWRLELRASSRVATKHFTLKDPPRLVIDFKKAAYTGPGHTLDAEPPFVKQVRVGEQPDFTRYVLDFEGAAVPRHKLTEHPDGVTVVFTP